MPPHLQTKKPSGFICGSAYSTIDNICRQDYGVDSNGKCVPTADIDAETPVYKPWLGMCKNSSSKINLDTLCGDGYVFDSSTSKCVVQPPVSEDTAAPSAGQEEKKDDAAVPPSTSPEEEQVAPPAAISEETQEAAAPPTGQEEGAPASDPFSTGDVNAMMKACLKDDNTSHEKCNQMHEAKCMSMGYIYTGDRALAPCPSHKKALEDRCASFTGNQCQAFTETFGDGESKATVFCSIPHQPKDEYLRQWKDKFCSLSGGRMTLSDGTKLC